MNYRTILALLTVMILWIGATGCHTAHGFGKDVEDAGKSIQKNTK